jgi:hypothetical protein
MSSGFLSFLDRVRRTAGEVSLDLLGLALADAQDALDLPQ